MWVANQSTDANGIVLFDPQVVAQWRPALTAGYDLFHELTTMESGDEALRLGIIVPILAIDDGGYDIVIRMSSEHSPVRGERIVTNMCFPLRVDSTPVIADLAVLRHWLPGVDWTPVPIEPGLYGVTIHGFRQMSSDRQALSSAGYELVLERTDQLPVATADTALSMRVLNWWDAPA